MRAAFAGVLFGLALAGLPMVARSQNAPAPAGTVATQTFKSWALDCLVQQTGEGADKQVFFIYQETRSKNKATEIIARIVVRRTGAIANWPHCPPPNSPANAISVAIDADKAHPMAIQACLPKFYYGAIEMTIDLQAEAKAGQQMNLTFTAKDQGPQQVSVPLTGITAALVALAKSGS
jgi:invasion protein IalB